MNSFSILPIPDTQIKRIYEAAHSTDPGEIEEVQYLLGVIEGVLGDYFIVESPTTSKGAKDE